MPEEKELAELIRQAKNILIIQPDIPDGDSLGSAIALEQIMTILGKQAEMYCAVSIPSYLKYLTGWSRVERELPTDIDLSIIVDTSALSLLKKIPDQDLARIKASKVVIIDHHKTEATIDFAKLIINKTAVATGEIIYDLAQANKWELNQEAREMLAISILSDSLGLMTDSTTSHSIRIIADLVDQGVKLPHIDSLRRETYRKSLELTRYKGDLLTRIETYLDNKLSLITIPWAEIEKYSPLYNPSMLVIDDMRLIENNAAAIALKLYKDGYITGKIRCNEGFPIAAKIAEHFGGGGHKFASGFKTTDYSLDNLIKELISVTANLLKENH